MCTRNLLKEIRTLTLLQLGFEKTPRLSYKLSVNNQFEKLLEELIMMFSLLNGKEPKCARRISADCHAICP